MNEHGTADVQKPHTETKGSILKNSKSTGRIRIQIFMISVAIIIVLAVSLAAYRLFAPNSKAIQPPASIKEMVDASFSQNPTELSVDTSRTEIEELPPEENSPPNVPKESIPDPKTLEILNEIHYELKQNRDALVYFDKRIESLLTLEQTIESMIAAHIELMETLKIRMKAIEAEFQRSRELFEIGNPDKLENVESRPPFRLIAIDRWENQWNAIIELDGRITMIQPHDSRTGWKLIQLHPAKGSATFRSSSAKQVTLQIQ